MHVAIVKSVQNGKTYYSKLLRRSYRDEKGRVQKETVLNLAPIPDGAIAVLQKYFAGKAIPTCADDEDPVEVLDSPHHGAVMAVQSAFNQLGFERLISSTPSRERKLVCAMVAARILQPDTKLATTRWWNSVSLAAVFGVEDAIADDLYAAMDWLLQRQNRIQGKLARRHLANGETVLWDLTSVWMEGNCCPLARRGYSRDGKRGKLQITFGLLCDKRGRPVAVSVYPGNTVDSTTVMDEIRRLRSKFNLDAITIVGDRGMIVQATIQALAAMEGADWITALKSDSIRKLLRSGKLAPLAGDVTLCEIYHPDFPGERLIACRNTALARRRAFKRQDLLAATEDELDAIRRRVVARRLQGAGQIGVAAGKVVNRFKVAKHFAITITDNSFDFQRKQEKIRQEAALDGIYVIRTSLQKDDMTAADCVRSYKWLTRVERAFRSIKTVDLEVRPVHHRLADRVRAHVFLCMLAYYVEWHMRKVWAPMLFADPDLEAVQQTRDPVKPAKPSQAVKRKSGARGRTNDGAPVHSFRTLLTCLSAITLNRCRIRGFKDSPVFTVATTPNPEQRKALNYLKTIPDI